MDDKVIVALAAFGGAVAGSLATIVVQLLKHWMDERSKSRSDRPRKALLRKMLSSGRDWRQLSTLMHVIGADEETTKRLLLEVGARGSENGEPLWALIKNKPLPTVQ